MSSLVARSAAVFSTNTRELNAFATRTSYSQSTRVYFVATSTQIGVLSLLNLPIQTPSQPLHDIIRESLSTN